MSNPIASAGASGLLQPQAGQATEQKGQPAKSAFEDVLKGTDRENAEAGQINAIEGPTNTSGSQIEQLRLDLMQRTRGLDTHIRSMDQMMPDLGDARTRRGLLQEAMQGMKSPVLGGRDFKSVLGGVETQWLNVERIMTSEQTLSTGELLGLQARLYQVAQHVEVVSKVIDQVTGGVKTILNTNV